MWWGQKNKRARGKMQQEKNIDKERFMCGK